MPKEVKELSSNYPKPPHIAVVAAIIEEATRLMAIHFALSRTQVTHELRKMDMEDTIASQICPTFLMPVRCEISKYRTLSGMCNNLIHPSWASARSAMVRYVPPAYPDGISQPRTLSINGNRLPNPRLLSTVINDGENKRDSSITVMIATWGQVIVHDINFGSPTLDERGNPVHCCAKNKEEAHPACMPYEIPDGDYFYKYYNRSCLNFVRLTPSLRPGCPLGPREPMNLVSGFLDASIIYGSTSDTANHLRERKNGRLKSSKPYHELGLKDLLPPQTNKPDFLCQRHNRPTDLFCFEGGDLRSNQQLPLTLMHTILMREHNRISDYLAFLVPGLDDNTIFEETRRIVIAQLQIITYREFLPIVVGEPLIEKYGLQLKDVGYYKGYDPKVNAESRVAFQAAAFRFGHSLVPDVIKRFNKNHEEVSSLRLSHVLRQPFELYKPAIIDSFLLGLVNQLASRMDPTLTTELLNHLFERPGAQFGGDLAAANIQRGRDVGLPGYIEYREYCGLGRAEKFSDLVGFMSNKTIHKLASVYE